MKRTIIIIVILIILIIPFFILNEKTITKKKSNIKKDNISLVENDTSSERFEYITSGHDNINWYIKEEVKEEEKIIYVCMEE